MKYIIIALFLLMSGAIKSVAQVTQASVLKATGTLVNYINSGNTSGQTNTLEQISGLMNTQITWLKARIEINTQAEAADRVKATADVAAAQSEKTQAEADLAKANAEMNSDVTKATLDIEKAEKAILKAKDDDHLAHSELDKANNEANAITNDRTNLAADQKTYDEIQALKTNIMHATPAMKDKAVADLKIFASTLQ